MHFFNHHLLASSFYCFSRQINQSIDFDREESKDYDMVFQRCDLRQENRGYAYAHYLQI